MEAFDTNKDGKISLEEYLGTYVKKRCSHFSSRFHLVTVALIKDNCATVAFCLPFLFFSLLSLSLSLFFFLLWLENFRPVKPRPSVELFTRRNKRCELSS